MSVFARTTSLTVVLLLTASLFACDEVVLDGGDTKTDEAGSNTKEGYLAVSIEGQGLFVLHPDGSDRRSLTLPCTPGIWPSNPSFGPDGSAIAYRCGDRVLGFDFVTRATRDWSLGRPEGVSDELPSWSPDGRNVVFTRLNVGGYLRNPQLIEGLIYRDGGFRVASASASSRLIVGGRYPVYSTDGRTLFYSVNTAVYSIDLPASQGDEPNVRVLFKANDTRVSGPEPIVAPTFGDDLVAALVVCDNDKVSLLTIASAELANTCAFGKRIAIDLEPTSPPARRADGLLSFTSRTAGGVGLYVFDPSHQETTLVLDTATDFGGANIDKVDFAAFDWVPPDVTP